jgi:chromosome segregation ATPase
MQEFDFDSLLEDIEETPTKIEVPEVPYVPEVPEVPYVPEVPETSKEIKPTEKDVAKVFNKKAIEEAKINSLKPDFSDEFKDMMQELEKYYKDTFDIKQQIKDLQEELKDRRNEAKEIGIKVTAADKAMKEVVAQIKESSEDAKYIEDSKRLIEENDSLYNIAVAEAN